jgi:Asp-tRNA(Asn)/Glu-tRNA(Gln) amidotransferase C subunit
MFSEIVKMLNKEGLLSIKDIYTDGTKLEANANRYSFVWGKSLQSRKEKMAQQIEELWQYAEQVSKEELLDTSPACHKAINPESVRETVAKIEEKLHGHEVDKKVAKKIKHIKQNWPEQLEKYREQEKALEGRNSYSKTDKDATFMRMKEDHLQNGQLKPAYNWQISTNKQFIVNYTVHQTAGDTTTLIPHLLEHNLLYGEMPEEITADAGYGSEENYEFAKKNEIDAYIKYNYFHKEETKKCKEDISRQDNLYYDEDKDIFICPMGQPMRKTGENKKLSAAGYEQTIAKYEAADCSRCPMRGACHKGKDNRIIEVNHNVRKHRKRAKEMLTSQKGLTKRSRRCVEPETVFGNIKHNKNFKRFMLRGLKKVEIEAGLMAIAHNLAKMAA